MSSPTATRDRGALLVLALGAVALVGLAFWAMRTVEPASLPRALLPLTQHEVDGASSRCRELTGSEATFLREGRTGQVRAFCELPPPAHLAGDTVERFP